MLLHDALPSRSELLMEIMAHPPMSSMLGGGLI